MTLIDAESNLPVWDGLCQFENAFPDYPAFPADLEVDTRFNIDVDVHVDGTSTWSSSHTPCESPSFDKDFFIRVASESPTILSMSDTIQPTLGLQRCSTEENDHVTLLVLAWTYILSARWAELIPGACGPDYSEFKAGWDDQSTIFDEAPTGSSTLNVDLGDISDDAARWRAAVLALEGGWNTTIISGGGYTLHSPWYTKLVSEQRFTLSRSTKSQPQKVQSPASAFTTALRCLSAYCEHHGVVEQSQAALAATLILPTVNYDDKFARLRTPRFCRKSEPMKTTTYNFPWNQQVNQIDRLITLNSNARGIRALLSSVFFEPDVTCNTCGAWLQGTFAFLNSSYVRDANILQRILIKWDPNLGFLWLDIFVLGAHTRLLRGARGASRNIELDVTAWTGTLMSLVQEPISQLPLKTQQISRADECRLLYLAHDQPYTAPSHVPFAPFGSTGITDTNIEVRQYVGCEESHRLEYGALTWRCRGGQRAVAAFPKLPLQAKHGRATDANICAAYKEVDSEDEDDEVSAMVTRNIFAWL
jgi:hypothetical protein